MAGPSLEDVRNAAAIAYGLNCIDDVDIACLYDYCHSRPLFSYWKLEEFDLAPWDEKECVTELRLAIKDLQLLMHYLEIPEKIVCSQGTVCSGIEGLCILLKRLAYTCRYSDLASRFGRNTSSPA